MYCPKCGKEIKDGIKFCNHCGAPMQYQISRQPQEKAYQQGKRLKKKKFKLFLIIFLIILILLLLGTGGYAIYRFGIFDEFLVSRKESVEETEIETLGTVEETEESEETEALEETEEFEKVEESGAEETLDTFEEMTSYEHIEEIGGEDYTFASEIMPETGSDYMAEIAQGEYILPESSSRYLTERDLEGLTKEQLRFARNEIYARHGRIFDSEDLASYFNSKDWYHGTVQASEFRESHLSQIEKDNIQLIKKREEHTP